MTTKPLFWDSMSDAWDSFEDRAMFERLWVAYGRSWYTTQLAMFQADFGKSIDYILPWTKYVWIKFTFDSTTLIPGSSWAYDTDDSAIISIPYFQDGITSYTVRRAEGTDYTVGDGFIDWHNEPDSTEMWAPIIYKDEKRIYNNWGILIGEESGDSSAYLNAVRGAIYSYWNGPTKRDIRNGLNVFYGLGFIDKPGTVFSVDSTSIEVKHGYNDYTTYPYDSGSFAAHNVGDVVRRFDALTSDIEVFDYITHPRWWRTYSIDIINKYYQGSSLSAAAREEINRLSKYSTFGIKIDAERYAQLDLLIPGMAIRFLDKIKPVYTDYFFIINNDFRSIDPDETSGDWLFFDDDGTTVSSTGLLEEYEIYLTTTFTVNYISYMAYVNGYEGNAPLTFDQYQTQPNESYDLDSDVVGFWEQLEIV